jgi:hypothetical protein
MDSGMHLELAKFHIADMLREAEQDRLARQVRKPDRSNSIDAVGFRARIARLLGGVPAIHAGGPRAAGA